MLEGADGLNGAALDPDEGLVLLKWVPRHLAQSRSAERHATNWHVIVYLQLCTGFAYCFAGCHSARGHSEDCRGACDISPPSLAGTFSRTAVTAASR